MEYIYLIIITILSFGVMLMHGKIAGDRISCPMCAERILRQAKICPFCKSSLPMNWGNCPSK